jgi:hypothetical protein
MPSNFALNIFTFQEQIYTGCMAALALKYIHTQHTHPVTVVGSNFTKFGVLLCGDDLQPLLCGIHVYPHNIVLRNAIITSFEIRNASFKNIVIGNESFTNKYFFLGSLGIVR